MKKILVTGGAGFFGGILIDHLLASGFSCDSIDLVPHAQQHPRLTPIQGDIRDRVSLRRLFQPEGYTAVFHCAAVLAHAAKDRDFLWTSNVDGTRNVAECCRDFRVPKLIFISSNCLWGRSFDRPVREEDAPDPAEIYGRSKLVAEKILSEYERDLHIITFRCPTIIDEGRLGLLAILFEFIDEGRKVWVVDGGKNKYQFIYAKDLAAACLRALEYHHSATFHIGADGVKSLREVYQSVISRAGTKARITSLPRVPTLFLMRLAYTLGVSPLGPYQYRMIAEDFSFNTEKIKRELQWQPTCSNEEMLWRAYKYYHDHREQIRSRQDVSAHRQAAKMGIIRLLKWFS
ncbi:MAG: NAD(P)-dependent oxidoreductase [bacterium]|nr:NAD(P)-dependent oxidoreductase [bacterium]